MALNVNVASLSLPVLEVVSEVAWREYKGKYMVYKLRGGKEPIRNLLGPKAVAHLEVYAPDTDLSQIDDDNLAKLLDKLYQPKSRVDTMARLKAVKMGDNTAWRVEEVVEYAAEFQSVLKGVPKEATPMESLVTRQFVSNLRPRGLGDELRMQELASLTDAVKMAVAWSSKAQEVSGIMGLSAGKTDRVGSGKTASGFDPTPNPQRGGPGRGPAQGAAAPDDAGQGKQVNPKQAFNADNVKCYLCGHADGPLQESMSEEGRAWQRR